jgi:hypothetical protein
MVSACSSNDSDATLKVGTTSDDDGYLTAAVIGDSGAPAEKTRTDFAGALVSPTQQYPHIADGTVVMFTLDFDGSSGTAGQNVTITAILTPG